MSWSHIVRYHVAIPLGLILVLVVAGAPLGTALVVGMMSGCLSMMFMMMRHGSHEEHDREPEQRTDPR